MRVITQIVHAKKKRSQASTSACPSSTVSSSTMIREHPRFQKTAIIFVSAIQMTDLDLLRGYQLGAVDYVPVPVIPELLRGLAVAARALLLLGLFPSVLGRLMMTNDAAGAGAENAVMSSIMPGDSADGGAL